MILSNTTNRTQKFIRVFVATDIRLSRRVVKEHLSHHPVKARPDTYLVDLFIDVTNPFSWKQINESIHKLYDFKQFRPKPIVEANIQNIMSSRRSNFNFSTRQHQAIN